MDKISKKAIIITTVVAVAFFSFCYFLNVNNFTSSKQFTTEGSYIEEKAHFSSDFEGTKGGISLYFKLDSGEVVQFRKSPLTKVVKTGDRVRIFYRKGVFLKNNIYDKYEPLAPSRYWSDLESSVSK